MKDTGFYVYTFGCKVNIFESEAMGELLLERGGFFRADTPGDADVIIINTCAVTEESEKKALKLIRRVKRENPKACLLVCGCMAQLSTERIEGAGADIIFGNTKRTVLPELIAEWKKSAGPQRAPLIYTDRHSEAELFERLSVKSYGSLTRANLKIEDGCDCYCAYCVIPFARGHVRSLPPDDVREMAREFTRNGHREIVLTGINIGMYGRDIGKSLYDAVAAAREGGALRIRLGSIEIDLIDDDTIMKLAQVEELCPHFHTSLQSGSDTVLRRMNRRYDAAEYMRKIDLLKDNFGNPSVTTDIIVGFPGETEDEFNETVEFARRVGFYKMHVFPYSIRPGTAAASMPEQVPEEIKKKRAELLGALDVEMRGRFINGQLGIPQSVLVETVRDGFAFGHTANYIYVKIPLDGGAGGGSAKVSRNEFADVRIKAFGEDAALGELI